MDEILLVTIFWSSLIVSWNEGKRYILSIPARSMHQNRTRVYCWWIRQLNLLSCCLLLLVGIGSLLLGWWTECRCLIVNDLR